jgi:hypothetical protein
VESWGLDACPFDYFLDCVDRNLQSFRSNILSLLDLSLSEDQNRSIWIGGNAKHQDLQDQKVDWKYAQLQQVNHLIDIQEEVR